MDTRIYKEKRLLKYHLNDNHDEILAHTTTNTNTTTDDDKLEENEERKSLPQILVELVLENSTTAVLFKDEFNVPHILLVMLQDHYEVLPVDSTKFKRYLSKLYYDTYEGKIANGNTP